MTETQKRIIQIRMFGEFRYRFEETVPYKKVTFPRLQQLLIACLVSHRGSKVPASELIEILYAEENGEMMDPLASLRGLVFRLRAQLKKAFGEEGALLIQTEGANYLLNPEAELDIDVDRFMDRIHRADQTSDTEERIRLLTEALSEYEGVLLSEHSGSAWVTRWATYFRAIFMESAEKLLNLLKAEGRYEQMKETARMVLEREPLEESFYVYEMEADMGLGDFTGAQECYRRAVTMLFDHLGNSSMSKLEAAHEELMKRTQIGQASIEEAVESLHKGRAAGAFFCDYGVFREIYQLEERRSERLGVSVYLAMISGEIRISSRVKDEEYRRKVMAEGMQVLQDVMIRSLRSGDVLTRFSDSQYLLLLPTAQYETAMMVLDRVKQEFNRSIKVRNVFLHFAIREV